MWGCDEWDGDGMGMDIDLCVIVMGGGGRCVGSKVLTHMMFFFSPTDRYISTYLRYSSLGTYLKVSSVDNYYQTLATLNLCI